MVQLNFSYKLLYKIPHVRCMRFSILHSPFNRTKHYTWGTSKTGFVENMQVMEIISLNEYWYAVQDHKSKTSSLLSPMQLNSALKRIFKFKTISLPIHTKISVKKHWTTDKYGDFRTSLTRNLCSDSWGKGKKSFMPLVIYLSFPPLFIYQTKLYA